jgi:hypothetical protein
MIPEQNMKESTWKSRCILGASGDNALLFMEQGTSFVSIILWLEVKHKVKFKLICSSNQLTS